MSKSNSLPNMQIMTKCPMCDFKYEKEDIKLVKKNEGVIALHLNCRQCKSSLMMLIMAGALGVTSISMMTDIVEDDIEKVNSNKCVNYDDVLEMHKFLKKI